MTRDERSAVLWAKIAATQRRSPVRGVLRMARVNCTQKKHLLQTLFCPKKAFPCLTNLSGMFCIFISFYLLDKDIIAETAPHSTPAQAQMIHVKSHRFVKKLTARKIAVTEHQ